MDAQDVNQMPTIKTVGAEEIVLRKNKLAYYLPLSNPFADRAGAFSSCSISLMLVLRVKQKISFAFGLFVLYKAL